MYALSVLLLFLAVYSFLGWLAEVADILVTTKHLQNRGFLTGPFIPIYGFGAIALIVLVVPYIDNPFLVFVVSVVITSTLEFVTHLALDKFLHIKLWDYSSMRFNLQGRVCLVNSLLFGMLGLLLIYVLHPAVVRLLLLLPHEAAIALASALIGILLVDGGSAIGSLARLRPLLDEVSGTLSQTHDRIERGAVRIQDVVDESRLKTDATHLATLRRLSQAFPHPRSSKSSAHSSSSRSHTADLG